MIGIFVVLGVQKECLPEYFRFQAKTFKFRYLSLAFSSGIPIEISLSKRPARRSAGSSESGLLVAPITRTCASGLLFRSESKAFLVIMQELMPKWNNNPRKLLGQF